MIQNIIKGINGYSGALALISRLKLWKYFFIPIIISIITAAIIGVTAYGLSDNIGQFIAKIWFWDWGKQTFTTISTIIGGIIIIAIGLILYKHIIMALSAPFMSPVSEKIETHITGIVKHNHRKTSFQEQLWRGIRINIRNLGRELLITIPILLLKFIPVVNIFSTALLIMVQSYYAGFGNMDYTLERHLNYKDSVKFIRQNRGLAIGNGLVFILCLFIPFIGVILVLPLSVTAGTLTTVKKLKTSNQTLM
ncbi:coproporphyrinogen III oxidase [Olleya aquimaris]|uniref:EI24 domain-containing protein n=1 Tax=Olleya sediminilitoris TaxID=2795739 RepID=A0ABS1WHJ0_9FLAO|nr:EI24 domain-containing protein [Olleya sediminilitoris]AXO80861.1 coproporphyrinogen III oxidase [Olleya aquimaris]MBL7558595.1 EI24 domain-containing protein [Olleya sediminilitoris]